MNSGCSKKFVPDEVDYLFHHFLILSWEWKKIRLYERAASEDAFTMILYVKYVVLYVVIFLIKTWFSRR